jgi:hypothetical protein
MSRLALGPNPHSIQCELEPSLVVKMLDREFDHSPPSSTAVKNEQSYIPTLPYGFIACTEVTAHLPSQI